MPSDLRALAEEPVGLAELADDLLRRVPPSSHRDEPPSPSHAGQRALTTGGPTSGGQATIEPRLAEAIRSFHLDALASAVPLNVDLDVVLSVLAGAVCASLRRRLGTGYAAATPDTLQRRFLHTGGTIVNHGDTIAVRLNRRTYSPVLRSADIPDTPVPWWGGRALHFEYA